MPDRRTLPGRLRKRQRGLEHRIAVRVLRIVGAADGAGRDDRRELRELLPRVWDEQYDRVWCVADLVCAQTIARADSQRVGKLLARHAGTIVGELVLHAVGADRDGRLWCLRRLHR